jgi:hypothetical protein
MSQDPGRSSPELVAEPPLTVGSWIVLVVAWAMGLISWGVWVFLAGYVVWRFLGGSAQPF